MPTKADLDYISHIRKAEDLDVEITEDTTEDDIEEEKNLLRLFVAVSPNPMVQVTSI
ncbi:hypothetical protein CWATWH0402_3900 [Crocosphaera watsonii WH 0402]|uniref:Uncharacterized protein n=1 Tax=Crocosphaera watsonii WH 0402 TaxID=1284629 RepID=T2JUB3_CROWT|nr:hypothetical protein CWATWH0402_3900 [Crocosphaera watsonii WH 0402]